MAKQKPETCDCCGRRRICQVEKVQYGAKTTWIATRHYCLKECAYLTVSERKKKSAESRLERKKNPRPKIAYPIIGGPLDGEYAATVDFEKEWKSSNPEWAREGGMYAHLSDEYLQFNRSGGYSKRIGSFPPSMVYIHKSVLKPLASPKDR